MVQVDEVAPARIRAFRTPEDHPALARLLTAATGAPVTAAELVRQDAARPADNRLTTGPDGRLTGYGRIRLLAEQAGEPVGWATAWRAPWTPPGDLASLLVLAPGRPPELLGELADALACWGRDVAARRLLGELPDDRAAHLHILLSRGHRIDAHVVSAAADLAPAAAVPAPRGSAFTTLATTTVPDPERRVYELYRDTVADNPGFVDLLPDFAGWRAEVLDGAGCRADQVFTAEADGRIVALTAVRDTPDPAVGHVDYTAVLRPWRGRGLARALKRHAAQVLYARGVRRLHTEVEASNAAMCAVNRTLGYRPGPGHYRTVRVL